MNDTIEITPVELHIIPPVTSIHSKIGYSESTRISLIPVTNHSTLRISDGAQERSGICWAGKSAQRRSLLWITLEWIWNFCHHKRQYDLARLLQRLISGNLRVSELLLCFYIHCNGSLQSMSKTNWTTFVIVPSLEIFCKENNERERSLCKDVNCSNDWKECRKWGFLLSDLTTVTPAKRCICRL